MINAIARLSAACIALLALAGPAAAQSELVFDLSPFTPEGVGGELIGASAASGHVVHARIDATFVSNQPAPWTMSVAFALPTGVAGIDSETQGWSGIGTFSASIQTEAFNGSLGPEEGQALYTWFLEWAGGAPFELPGGGVGLGPVDGTFTQLDGVPAGQQIWFHAWIPDPAAVAGFAASNALLATVPSDC